MDTNISKIMMVGRVNTERRLECLVIDIFEKFLLHVAQDACLIEPDEDGSDLKKKIGPSCQMHFFMQS